MGYARKTKGLLGRGLVVLGCLGIFLTGCGEATFFFIWNTGGLADSSGAVAVFVIGTPSEEEVESVQLVEGRIPRGMKLHSDGTVQGIPVEKGDFTLTLALEYAEGPPVLVTYEAHID